MWRRFDMKWAPYKDLREKDAHLDLKDELPIPHSDSM